MNTALSLLLIAFVVVNVILFLHARQMVIFLPMKQITGKNARLSLLEQVLAAVSAVSSPKPEHLVSPEALKLSFERLSFPTAFGRTLEGWYFPLKEGEKREELALLFHGYRAAQDQMLPVVPLLQELGIESLSVDFYGSGGSSGSSTSIGYYEALDVVHAVRAARRRWPGRPILLYGASMGAVAITRAVAIGEVAPSAVVLESPFDTLLNTVRHRVALMGLPSVGIAHLLLLWGGVILRFNPFQHTPAQYIRAVTCPTLLLYGAEDPKVQHPERERVAAALTAEKKEVIVLPEAGHELLAAHSPEQVQAAITRLLGE
ncbi:alpha/beta fold hydrolase [bacterium]|nr:alpha/beta fold hydrolase [bacterium]